MQNVYAQVGYGFQQVGGECPDGFIAMQSQRPDNDSVAAADGTWVPAPTPASQTVFSPREYLKRFTMSEYAAVRTGPIGVQYALDNLIGAQFVDINDPDVAAGLDAMVAAGVIGEARKAELLAPEPVPVS